MNDNNYNIKNIIILFTSLIVVGTIGYLFLLKTTLIDALYMTVITISTVGFKEVATMNPPAKLFSIFIIFWGVGTVGYTFTTLMVLLVEGRLKDYWRTKMFDKRISNLDNHFIVCGATLTGNVVIEQLQKDGAQFILIDEDESICHYWLERDVLTLKGKSTDAEVLMRAGVKRAKALASTLSEDVDNIVTVLTARGLNPDMQIISQAVDHDAIVNLTKVGADKTISVNEIGGRRMAALMTHPHIISFLDVLTQVGDVEIDLEDVYIYENSPFAGLSLEQAQIPSKTGLIVLAIRNKEGSITHFNPTGKYVINTGDTLIVMGRPEQVENLRALVK